MNKATKIIIGIIVAIVVIGGIWYGVSKKPTTPTTKEPIKIGVMLPLSGKNALNGQYIQQAIILAQEEINQNGGINGKKLEIIFEDDQCDPKVGATIAQKLINVDKVPLVLGPWCSSVALAVAPTFENSKTIMIAEVITPKLTTAGDYIFRVQPTGAFYMKTLAEEVVKTLGIKKAGVMYIGNDYGASVKDAFVKEFENNGGTVVDVEQYMDKQTDFRTELIKISQKNPQAILLASYAQDAGLILKQAKELGINVQFLGVPALENKDLIKIAGEAAEGLIYPYHFNFENPNENVQKFVSSYTSKFGHQPDGFAVLMYDGTYIAAKILEKCNSDTECMKNELYNNTFKGVTEIKFDSNGDPLLPINLKTIKNGQFVPYEK
jgi:branched-chain amino acid transport system substrate-binding protein